jgi:hypothetical protein
MASALASLGSGKSLLPWGAALGAGKGVLTWAKQVDAAKASPSVANATNLKVIMMTPLALFRALQLLNLPGRWLVRCGLEVTPHIYLRPLAVAGDD